MSFSRYGAKLWLTTFHVRIMDHQVRDFGDNCLFIILMINRRGLGGGDNSLGGPGDCAHLCRGVHPRQIHSQGQVQVQGRQRLPASDHNSDVKISRRVFGVLQIQTITSMTYDMYISSIFKD